MVLVVFPWAPLTAVAPGLRQQRPDQHYRCRLWDGGGSTVGEGVVGPDISDRRRPQAARARPLHAQGRRTHVALPRCVLLCDTTLFAMPDQRLA